MIFVVTLIAALVAALNPFALAGNVPSADRTTSALILGHVCGQAPSRDQAPAPHHDCLQCPGCLTPAAHAALLPAPPMAAAPRATMLARIRIAPPPRAPPAALPDAAYPRGPPTLL